MQQLIEPNTFSQISTVLQDSETSLRLFSSLKAGQIENSPSKKDNIHAWKSHYRQKVCMYKVRKRRKAMLNEKVESDEELVC